MGKKTIFCKILFIIIGLKKKVAELIEQKPVIRSKNWISNIFPVFDEQQRVLSRLSAFFDFGGPGHPSIQNRVKNTKKTIFCKILFIIIGLKKKVAELIEQKPVIRSKNWISNIFPVF